MSGWAMERSNALPLRVTAPCCPRVSAGWERDGGQADATTQENSGEGAERPLPSPPGPFLWPPLWTGRGRWQGRFRRMRALRMVSAASASVRGAAVTLKGCRAELAIWHLKPPGPPGPMQTPNARSEHGLRSGLGDPAWEEDPARPGRHPQRRPPTRFLLSPHFLSDAR